MNDNLKYNYSELIRGEIEIIHEELDQLNTSSYTSSVDISTSLDNLTAHLQAIEMKIGYNSVDYINISTEIVDTISNLLLYSTDDSNSESIIENLSPLETASFYSSQRENLLEGINICRRMEKINMDYAYRLKRFNQTRTIIENRCKDRSIDIRTSSEKSIDQLKKAGTITTEIAKDTAGCLLEMAIKAIIAIGIIYLLAMLAGAK